MPGRLAATYFLRAATRLREPKGEMLGERPGRTALFDRTEATNASIVALSRADNWRARASVSEVGESGGVSTIRNGFEAMRDLMQFYATQGPLCLRVSVARGSDVSATRLPWPPSPALA